MAVDQNGGWIPDISPKQLRLLNNTSRYLLVSGPRYSTKTVGCLHKLMLHGWRTMGGRISVIAISQTSAADAGVWTNLCQNVAPQWVENVEGLEWHRMPFTEGATKKQKFQITNIHGGVSTFQLDSLQVEADVEERFKNKEFTCEYVSELSMFYKEKTFLTWVESLRSSANQLPFEDYQFIGDTNPSDEGQDSWIYNLWYKLRLDRDCPEEYKPFVKHLDLMEFAIDDNIFVSKEALDLRRSQYMRDPDLKARYCDGLWTRATGDGIFSSVFKPIIHCLGESRLGGDDDILLPDENCSQLVTGSDLGDKNPAAVIIEPYEIEIERVIPDGTLNPDGSVIPSGTVILVPAMAFNVIDELVYVGEMIPTERFTEELMAKMDYWEKQLGRIIRWTHWSDADRWSAAADNYEHMIVYEISKKRIDLQQAEKGPGSVWPRVKIIQKVLFEDRLFVSSVKCPKTAIMFKSLRPGKGVNGEMERTRSIDKTSPSRHVFDALSYPISMELRQEMEHKIRFPKVGQAKPSAVMVPL